MRAHVKRKERNRRLTIIAAVAIVVASLLAGVYVALNTGSGLDSYIGKPVPASGMHTLYQLSLPPYGPAGTSMISLVGNASGQPFVAANGKPILVYIGAEFCPYCAAMRWPLILALERFGNFSNLHYMTSADDDGDFATFTFHGASYNSSYLVFQPFENENREEVVQVPVPSNYSVEWSQPSAACPKTSESPGGDCYPFLNFGNKYIVGTMLNPFNLPMGQKNWTQIYTSIETGDTIGTAMKQAANVITALICKITGGAPASVCSKEPDFGPTGSLVSYSVPFQPAFMTLVSTVAPEGSTVRLSEFDKTQSL